MLPDSDPPIVGGESGVAGLAGLLPTAAGPAVEPGERVAIVFSGVYRG